MKMTVLGLGLVFLMWAPCARAEEFIGLEAAAAEDALTGEVSELVICENGGEGASSCETKWTVNVSGWGWPTGCGISCQNGYFACCQNPTWFRNATCLCVEDRPRPIPEPLAPETPGL